MRDYDDWKLDTPDNHVVSIGECKHCEMTVYKGQDHVNFSEGLFHTDCWWEKEDQECEEDW